MAGEIQLAHSSMGKTLYAIIRNATGLVWQTTTDTFVAYMTANLANYDIAMTEQGTASRYYAGDFDSAIAAGVYRVTAYERAGGAPAEGDLAVGTGLVEWDGTNVLPRSDNADQLLDQTDGVEGSRTVRETLRLMLAALVGELSGAATTTVLIRDAADTKTRITATVDADGNRSAVTYDDT